MTNYNKAPVNDDGENTKIKYKKIRKDSKLLQKNRLTSSATRSKGQDKERAQVSQLNTCSYNLDW